MRWRGRWWVVRLVWWFSSGWWVRDRGVDRERDALVCSICDWTLRSRGSSTSLHRTICGLICWFRRKSCTCFRRPGRRWLPGRVLKAALISGLARCPKSCLLEVSRVGWTLSEWGSLWAVALPHRMLLWAGKGSWSFSFGGRLSRRARG